MPKENYLQKQVIDYLKTLPNSYSYVNHGSAYSGKGRPDIYLLWRGVSIFFELKKPGTINVESALSPDQKAHRTQIEWAGGHFYAPTSLAQVKEILESHFPTPKPHDLFNQ